MTWTFKSCDPFDELLLGPTYCSQQVLEKNNLDLETDIGVFEIHEAFAGQILSNLTAMESQKFANEKFNGKRMGRVDMNKLNTMGGSLALGHVSSLSILNSMVHASLFLMHHSLHFYSHSPSEPQGLES